MYNFHQKSTSCFLNCNFFTIQSHITLLAVSSKVVKVWSWSLWLGFLPTIIMSSAITMTCLILTKHWSSMHWMTFPATVTPNGITVFPNLPSSVLKVVRKDVASSSYWCQYPSCNTHRHDTCICKQMNYVLRCLEMITSPHYHFIKIGGMQADSKLQVTSLVFPLNKHKAVNAWVASCTGIKTPTFSILWISCLKVPFKGTGIGLHGVCLGVILESNCIWYGGTWKVSNTLKYIWVAL